MGGFTRCFTLTLPLSPWQFQFVNSYLSLFYIGFYLKDMERLKEVSGVSAPGARAGPGVRAGEGTAGSVWR